MNIQSYSAVKNLYPVVSKTFCLSWRYRDYKIKQKLMNMLIANLELTLKFMFAKSRLMGHFDNRVREGF